MNKSTEFRDNQTTTLQYIAEKCTSKCKALYHSRQRGYQLLNLKLALLSSAEHHPHLFPRPT